MRLSLRTLLAFEDNVFEREQHQQLERVIPQYDAALTTLNRIRSVMRNPRLGVPGLVDQREELDPNLVAEYLDHQMSEEIQERFEAYCLSSDKYLAEIASIHTILSNVLGEPARTSRECRLRCYDLYRQSTEPNSLAPTSPEEKRQEKNEQESFINASRQLFDDYLQSSSPLRKPTSTETPEFSQRPPVAAPVSNRPELIPLFCKNETENNSYLSHHLTQPQFSIFPASSSQNSVSFSAPPSGIQTPNNENQPISSIEEHWSIPTDNRIVSTVSTASKPSFIARFWNWLTTTTPQNTKPDVQKDQKTTKLGTLFLILLLCAAGLLGWNRLQKKETDSISNIPPKVMESNDMAKSNSFTVPIRKEKEKFDILASTTPTPQKEEPKKTVEVAVLQTPSQLQSDSIVRPSQLPVTPPPEVVIKTQDPFQLAVTESPKKNDVPVAIEALPKIAAPVKESPSIGNDQIEKIASFTPNPIRSGEPNAVVAKNNSDAHSVTTPTEDKKSVTRSAVRATIEQTFAKRDEVVRVESSTPTNDSHEITFKAIHSSTERSKPQLIASPERKPEPFDEDSIIAFQPISAMPKQRDSEMPTPEFVSPKDTVSQSEQKGLQTPDVWLTSVANHQLPIGRSEKTGFNEVANEPPTILKNVDLVEMPPLPAPKMSNTPNTSNIITVGEIRENDQLRPVGRVLSAKEPCVVFSASTASDQWEMKRLPLELRADQYLLTTAPFRAELELEGGFHVEMVGDSKLCVLEPDENGVPGIFIDYGRLVIRPIASNNAGAVRPFRIQTEKVQGIVRLIGSKSLIFVDTFAEILENPTGISDENHSLLPKTRPILGLLPDLDERISWQTDKLESPLVATRQAGILLVPEKPELGKIQGLPNWLSRLPLPQEAESFTKICRRIFDETGGNCEVALNRLIREPTIDVRSFGYRLWGDLGRFDIPLSFLSEANPDDEPIRQMLVPYFREVMKRDEETVQRLADAIEAVRR